MFKTGGFIFTHKDFFIYYVPGTLFHGGFYPPDSDITPYTKKVEEYSLAGLYAWRIDNDDTDHDKNIPRYTITSKMWEYVTGSATEPPLYP